MATRHWLFSDKALSISFVFCTFFVYSIIRNSICLPSFRSYNESSPPNIPGVRSKSLILVPAENSWYQYGLYFVQQSPLLNDKIIYARDKAINNLPSDRPPLNNILLKNSVNSSKNTINDAKKYHIFHNMSIFLSWCV